MVRIDYWQRSVVVLLALWAWPLSGQSQPSPASPAPAQAQGAPAPSPVAPAPAAAPATSPAAASGAQHASAAGPQIVLPVGTKLPLVMQNAITTRNAKPGDAVYFETIFPIVQNSKVVIPAGSFVYGEVVEAKRPGRVKGRAELYVRMNMLILPNSYTVNFNAIPTGAGTGGNESVTKEGAVKGDSDKTRDAGTMVGTTLAGAGIGSAIGAAAGNIGKGAGIGLGLGAAAGLIAVLLSRGPEIDLPRGTTLDVELDRALSLDAAQINFTDPGHASTLSGPPNRAPVRSNRFPY